MMRNINEYIVSAIVSTYNSERYIRGCIEDLEEQTISDRLEIIVINSGSKQNEEIIVKECQEIYPNIKYIKTDQRETVYAAWNRGIKAANGRYITNANTDDRHRRDAFERMVNVLEMRPNIALVYADVIKTDSENATFDHFNKVGEFKWYDWDRNVLLNKGCFIGPQPMWRQAVHELYGHFDDSLVTSGDYEFWLRISQTYEFIHMGMPLGLYLLRDDSIEKKERKKKRAEDSMIHCLYLDAARGGFLIKFRPFYQVAQLISESEVPDTGKLRVAIEQIEELANIKAQDPQIRTSWSDEHENKLKSKYAGKQNPCQIWRDRKD
jgi:glycosyltransferase involved in cell wall biosynthesis